MININAGVIFDISRLLADQLQLSLCYDPDPGRLTLGIQVIVTIIKIIINNNNNVSIIINNNIILFIRLFPRRQPFFLFLQRHVTQVNII